MTDEELQLDEKPELNITPLVDVMLVLLAILMVSVPSIAYQENITLPRGSKSQKLSQDSMLEVRVSIDRKIYIRDNVYEFEGFTDNFTLFSAPFDKNMQVFIRADKNLRYDDVIYILKSIKEAGFLRVSLVTSA
ncbi:MAG: biopolymer transporter ExbD [Helicobacter sp.]|uniref:ExbD/TolR family protein n=1 Tax=Helicobacter sp. 10-6591 TaxID=2004998 RepID=UPI000DCBA3AD|nr:biopolymer transporter ExbD [Helicobacter sp. 10-6591]MCI6217423.1 biopolymer transporter ExbD [Helicobacter sp.]MCI7484570.1 biopolymer transporter ExbD [Helicobacter sp.]RAX54805.1 biopolymer transporter ExbD [Helicobacter sp. 10-6591]